MKVLSLFSGIGGFEKALDNLEYDYELVGFSEIDKWAIKSYCAIHDVDESLNLGDVSKIKSEDLPSEVDLVTYGFPCQDLSIAGTKKGIAEGTRSGLLYEAERIIEHTKPKYAIAENVKNLLSKTFKDDFDELLDRLDDYGYNSYWQVLDSQHYGIPQQRQRVFIVSIRKDIDDGTFQFPEPIELPILVNDIIETDIEHTYYPEGHMVYDNYQKDKVDKSLNPITTMHVTNSRTFGNSVRNNGIAYTLTATTPNGIMEEDGRIRKFTPLEAFRLMGFDDSDLAKIEGVSNHQLYRQTGNSIVVNVAQHLLESLLM